MTGFIQLLLLSGSATKKPCFCGREDMSEGRVEQVCQNFVYLQLVITKRETTWRRSEEKKINEWTSTGKTWPLSATFMAIIVSLTFLVYKEAEITWLHALIGLPLLCFAVTGLLYKLLFPTFRRNGFTNALVHLVWTALVAIATSYIATKTIHWDILMAILPVGLICSGITHGLGKGAAYSYAFEIMSTYAYVAVLTIIGIFPMTSIMVFITIAIAIGCSKTIINSTEGAIHLTKDLGARTANLLHLFSILLAVAFAVARFL